METQYEKVCVDERRGHGGEIHVLVYAPKTPDPKEFTWLKTMKVGDAAREAATAFGYHGGSPGLENARHEVLNNNKSLAEQGVDSGDKLELIDGGGGV